MFNSYVKLLNVVLKQSYTISQIAIFFLGGLVAIPSHGWFMTVTFNYYIFLDIFYRQKMDVSWMLVMDIYI